MKQSTHIYVDLVTRHERLIRLGDMVEVHWLPSPESLMGMGYGWQSSWDVREATLRTVAVFLGVNVDENGTLWYLADATGAFSLHESSISRVSVTARG